MSDILERAKAHFREQLDSDSMQFVEVPEWGEKKTVDGEEILVPLKIFYKPMTLRQQDQIFKYVREGSLKSICQTLITRALNEDGTKMFKPIHMLEFETRVDPAVMERIVESMAGDEPDEKELTKN